VTVAPELAVPQLEFDVKGVAPAEHAVVPTLLVSLAVDAGGRDVRSLALDVQIRIDAARRGYDDVERERLFELFGPPHAWSRSLRSFRWTTVSLTVPPFDGATTVELAVPCTYDFDVAASKYLHALGDDGNVPLELLFSGTVFFSAADGRLQVARLSWDREARCALAVRVWREAVDRVFPGTAWLRIRRDVFDRLQAYKSKGALLSWDAALEQLLEDAHD